MQRFPTGPDFEEAVFGVRSNGASLFRRFGNDLTTFGEDLNNFIRSSKIEKPPTQIGGALHHQVERQLEGLGIDPLGLVFIPSVDTSIDLYGVDGLFYLPALFPHLVTVDAFNIDPLNLKFRKEKWIDSFEGEIYRNEKFQSDLFLFKNGVSRWRKDREMVASEKAFLPEPPDLRRYGAGSDSGRWKNRFVLTPLDVGTYEKRRDFAKLVAGYFAKVAKESNCQNMALLSH